MFGEGPQNAQIMLVGEQPGDKEDLAGKPFVGPAGQMLDRALDEAGIDRSKVYVTNAVKHFKFVPRGKIRLHQKPNTPEIKACRQWYERERAAIKPALVVAMGATAAQSVFGKITPVNKSRGRLIDLEDGTTALVTVHPSYLLRLPDADAKAREYQRFVDRSQNRGSLAAKIGARCLKFPHMHGTANSCYRPLERNATKYMYNLQLMDDTISFSWGGVGASCSRHDVPMGSARCAVSSSPGAVQRATCLAIILAIIPCSDRPCLQLLALSIARQARQRQTAAMQIQAAT